MNFRRENTDVRWVGLHPLSVFSYRDNFLITLAPGKDSGEGAEGDRLGLVQLVEKDEAGQSRAGAVPEQV